MFRTGSRFPSGIKVQRPLVVTGWIALSRLPSLPGLERWPHSRPPGEPNEGDALSKCKQRVGGDLPRVTATFSGTEQKINIRTVTHLPLPNQQCCYSQKKREERREKKREKKREKGREEKGRGKKGRGHSSSGRARV